MAAKANVFHGDHTARSGARSRLTAAGASHTFQPSPALILQDSLSYELSGREDVKKWPPLATAAFIAGTCGAFWAAVAVAVGVARAF